MQRCVQGSYTVLGASRRPSRLYRTASINLQAARPMGLLSIIRKVKHQEHEIRVLLV